MYLKLIESSSLYRKVQGKTEMIIDINIFTQTKLRWIYLAHSSYFIWRIFYWMHLLEFNMAPEF